MNFFETVRAILGRSSTTTAELRDAISKLDVASLDTAVTVAEQARTALLLGGTDAAIDKADEILRIARRDRDRAGAAQTELTRRLAEAEVREAREALDAEFQAVADEAATVENLLRSRWIALQVEMVELLGRLNRAENAVTTMNTRLEAAGRADLIEEIEARVFPPPAGQYRELYRLGARVQLPSVEGADGWHDAARP